METLQCSFITKDVCLNLYKFGCYLMQVGTLPKVYILGMVLLIFYKIINRHKEDKFSFLLFQVNPKDERRVGG